jgi:hypothetical protein
MLRIGGEMLSKVTAFVQPARMLQIGREMLSKITAFLPFCRAVSWYSGDARRKALPKFLVLWGMSLAPLLLAALLQEIPVNESMFSAFCKKFGASFFARHQFIYAVSFITPIFYFLWERHHGLLNYFLSRKRSLSGVKLIPPGFGVVLIWSIIFFLLTTVAYAVTQTRTNPAATRTILESGSDIITVVVYVFGLLCWYFMILDGSVSAAAEYFQEVEQQEEKEKEQAQAFSDRISASEDEA